MQIDAYTLNRHGYDIIDTDITGAISLFHAVLDIDQHNFCALFGIVYAYLNHIEHQQSANATAIGLYLVTQNEATGRWELTAENQAKADYYGSYLNRAITHTPAKMQAKVKLFQHYNVVEAKKRVDQMIAS